MTAKATGFLLAALLLFVPLASAQEAGQPGRVQRPSIQQVLDLTDRQVAELEELRTAQLKKTQDVTAQIRDLDAQRRALLNSSEPDVVKVGSIAFQIQSLQQQIEEANKAYSKDLLSLLDSGQQEKVQKIKEALELAPQAGPLMQYGFIEGFGRGGAGRIFTGPGGMGPGGGSFQGRVPPSAPPATSGGGGN